MTDPSRQQQLARINAELRRQSIRPAFLQELYRRSGRTCGTFSGLWTEFRQQCLQDHLDALAEQLAQEKRRVWGEQREVENA